MPFISISKQKKVQIKYNKYAHYLHTHSIEKKLSTHSCTWNTVFFAH